MQCDKFVPIPLKINCGYVRTAIRELTPKKAGIRSVDKKKRAGQIIEQFCDITLPRNLFVEDTKGNTKFDKYCDTILNCFSKRWTKQPRVQYENNFSTSNWKKLTTEKKKAHTVSNCTECSTSHTDLQESFTGKPVFQAKPSVSLSLPDVPQAEKAEVCMVLSDLNQQWNERHGHSYTSVLPKMAPQASLTPKKTKIQQKRQGRIQKRKIVDHINERLKEDLTLTVLAEAESMQAYNRKRLAMSFELPSQPNKPKSHTPSTETHAWSHEEANHLLTSQPVDAKINWTNSARMLNIPGKNAGQILKEYASKEGFNILALEQKHLPTPTRIRRSKKRLPGREVSIPSLPLPQVISTEKNEMVASGRLSLGEPCSPYTVKRSVVTSDGEVETQEVNIIGRKLSLLEIRKKLIEKQQPYMRLMTNEQIELLNRSELTDLMNRAHHPVSDTASIGELQLQLARLQRTRTLAFWHDHSTILQQGYILFAVTVLYDPAVFFTEEELKAYQGRAPRNLQEEIEQPSIHMIAPCTSAVSCQLALTPDRIECLKELSEPITHNGIPITDKARFFFGDKPAQQFERGTQIGGAYKCGGCGCVDKLIQDFAHAVQCPHRSVKWLQTLVTAGKFGTVAGKLKPLDKLLIADLKAELTARGYQVSSMKKPEMQSLLTEELKGAQRVPALLITNPTQSLDELNLQDYEILNCEPLHDLKGHTYNLLQEIPYLLPHHKEELTHIIESTLGDTSSGVHLRVALIKVYLKILNIPNVDDDLKQLLASLVKMSQILYVPDSGRNPKTVLQLYNVTWVHHELCCPHPKTQTRDKLYGTYFHDLLVHAPTQFQMVCLRSTNAESTERLFSQIKHISQRATNRKPDNVVATILLSMQAREQTGATSTISSLDKQVSMVSKVGRKVPQYSGTLIKRSFINNRMPSWQAHLQRISMYLKRGEGVWWKIENNNYLFSDSDNDPNTQPQGPTLQHFRDTNLSKISEESNTDWAEILESSTKLPTPFIRVFKDGTYIGRTNTTTTEQDNDSDSNGAHVHDDLTQNEDEPMDIEETHDILCAESDASETAEDQATFETAEDQAINCNLSNPSTCFYTTKAANQISKLLGRNSTLQEFDIAAQEYDKA